MATHFCKWSLIEAQPHLFLSHCIGKIEGGSPTKLKIFAVWPFTENIVIHLVWSKCVHVYVQKNNKISRVEWVYFSHGSRDWTKDLAHEMQILYYQTSFRTHGRRWGRCRKINQDQSMLHRELKASLRYLKLYFKWERVGLFLLFRSYHLNKTENYSEQRHCFHNWLWINVVFPLVQYSPMKYLMFRLY